MTADATRRLAFELREHDQRRAKEITTAMDDKARMDWLADAGVAHIYLSDGSCIDVRGARQTLRDVIDGVRFPPRGRVSLPACAEELGAALDGASLEQGEPS